MHARGDRRERPHRVDRRRPPEPDDARLHLRQGPPFRRPRLRRGPAALPQRPQGQQRRRHVQPRHLGRGAGPHRREDQQARQGIALDRSTLCDWVGRACWWLEPLWRLLRRHVMGSTRIFADDTPLPVLDPGRGRTKTGRLWAYAVDDRPWHGSTPPAVVYLYAEDRKGERPAAHLAEFRGVLQVDGYGGFKGLLENRPPGEIRLAFCWAHCRRRFYDIHQETGSPLAEEALRRIGELYRSRPRSAAARPRSGARSGTSAAGRSWTPCMAGSWPSWGGSRALHPGRGDPLRPAALGRAGAVPRRRPARAGHQHGRAGDPAVGLGRKNSPVRRLRWRGPPLGDRGEPGGDREAERGRALGLAHRRARARGLGPNQGRRARAAPALELEGRTARGGGHA